MKRSFFILFVISLVFTFTIHAQKKRISVSPKNTASQISGNTNIGVVVDSRLAILRKEPSLYSDSIQRMRHGRILSISATKEVEGITYYRVLLPPKNYGWVQAEAVIRKNKREDEERLIRLIQASKGFDKFERGAVYLENFPNSQIRPAMLLLLGDLAEELTLKLSRDVARQFDRNEMLASGASLQSFYLSHSSLDRYRKLGINFWFNSASKRFHYDGNYWREIVAKYPKSNEAEEAKLRLEALDKSMAIKADGK